MTEPTPVSGAEVLAAAASAGPYRPEHDKMQAVATQSGAIGDFLDWCNSNDVYLTRHMRGEDGTPLPSHHNQTIYDDEYEALLAEFFAIDLRKVAAEKDAMLGEIRAANKDARPGQTPAEHHGVSGVCAHGLPLGSCDGTGNAP